MRIAAAITSGWNDDPRAENAASILHDQALSQNSNYVRSLTKVLKSATVSSCILGLDHLFRRHADGFRDIKTFVGALAAIPADAGYNDPLICHIDAFAYAFLKGAKNFDLLLPPDHEANILFRNTCAAWVKHLDALADFERFGKPLPDETRDNYLALRKIVARASARDEQRTLTTLLISGPSTLDQLRQELGLNESLAQRTLSMFEHIGIIERRMSGSADAPVFVIAEASLALVVFCLRETIGLDPLSALPEGE